MGVCAACFSWIVCGLCLVIFFFWELVVWNRVFLSLGWVKLVLKKSLCPAQILPPTSSLIFVYSQAPWHLFLRFPLIFPFTSLLPLTSCLSLPTFRDQRKGTSLPDDEGHSAPLPQGELRGLQICHQPLEQVSEWDGLWQPRWLHRRSPSPVTSR